MNKDKIILDLCGGTGAWSKPYKDAGYDVLVWTLPSVDLNYYDFCAETYLSQVCGRNVFKVYGILATPPCTMFSFARSTAKSPRDFEGAMILVKKCLDIIWHFRTNYNLKFWALENPMGYLRQFLGKPPLTFDPCDFGNGYTKKTDLWGYYNIPKKNPVKLTNQEMRDCSINNRILPNIPKDYTMPHNMTKQSVRRAITSQGFAQAFYKANK
ncbi:MAG: hypothetical protein KAQ99_08810 [Candidatus Aureabacteria bacterium]|nr:hypothetical protein [Candidatus Auribacterota bacterium]